MKRSASLPAVVILVVLSSLSTTARAAIGMAFGIEDIQGADWRARGIAIDLVEQDAGRLTVSIEVADLDLPQGYGNLQGLRLECPQALRTDQAWQCAEGRLQVRDSPIQAQDETWQGGYTPDDGWRLSIPRLAVAQGTVAVELTLRDGAWSAHLTPHRVSVPQLATLGRVAGFPRDWGVEGRASGSLAIDGADAGATRIAADLLVDQLRYASADGAQAAEKLVFKAELEARLEDAAWHFDAHLGWPRGALYSEPLYLDADQGPVDAKVIGHWEPGRQRLQLDSWSVQLAQAANVAGTGLFVGPDFAVRDLTIAAQSDDAGSLYQRLLQPFLIGSAADDMEVAGRVGVALHFDGEGLEQAGLELKDLVLADRQGRFALGRSSGSVAWDRSTSAPLSRLTVADASLFRIPTGSFGVKARFAADRIQLVEPVVVPLLGGEMALDSFEMTGALVAGAAPRWEASASVRNVSLEQLTQILEWPPFEGVVGGQLRNMHYADQVFAIGGGLDLSAFEGDIRVNDLRIQEPFGVAPTLEADATLRGLNLEKVTRTFSFGRIEGTLDGDVGGLRLVAWQPDGFDLHLYTPPGGESRRRISQRAVENLTELGSGIPAGLSSTVLRLFEEFRYDRIDLRIRLQGDVAQIDGLARPDGGYYLVRGAGLPRIDVIGRNRSVAWRDLVERLRQIQVEGAQIQ